MSPARLKFSLLLGGLAASGLVLIAWTQVWFDLVLTSGQDVAVAGEVAAGALTALALAGLALGAALAIAGPVFRVILGVLQISIGGLVVLSATMALTDPVSASSAAVTSGTGVSGDESVRALVASVAASPWPVITLVLGAVLVVLGLLVIVTARRWPASSRKYQTVRLENADGPRSTVGDWDSLSEGRDPT
jgi:hypothetical protein